MLVGNNKYKLINNAFKNKNNFKKYIKNLN